MRLTKHLISQWVVYVDNGNRFRGPAVTMGYDEHVGRGYQESDHAPDVDQDVLLVDWAYTRLPEPLRAVIKIRHLDRGDMTAKIPDQSNRNKFYAQLDLAMRSWQRVITEKHDTAQTQN